MSGLNAGGRQVNLVSALATTVLGGVLAPLFFP